MIETLGILPLDYNISEEFFKEKIGTGDALKELLNNGCIKRYESDFFRMTDRFKTEYRFDAPNEEKKSLQHKDLLESFYLPKIGSSNIVDYADFYELYNIYLNASYHLKQINDFDGAIDILFKIAKKMILWGKKDLVIERLNNFNQKNITSLNYLWKLYYTSFAEIIPFYNRDIDESRIRKSFQEVTDSKDADYEIKAEFLNLWGSFIRIYKKSNQEALEIYTQALETSKDLKHSDMDKFHLNSARILQNMAFCHLDIGETEIAKEEIEKAVQYLKNTDDLYEAIKIYIHKAMLYHRIDMDDPEFDNCFAFLSKDSSKMRFPDIERKLYNLLAEIKLSKEKQFKNYLTFKCYALDCDLVLYFDCFNSDLMGILGVLLKTQDKKERKEIAENLSLITEFLNSADLSDESNFIEAISCFILNKKQSKKTLKQIKNESLIKIFEGFTKRFKE